MVRLQLLHKVDGAHDDSCWAAAWVPGSNKLLTGSADESVKVWEEKDAKLENVGQHTGNTLGVVSLATEASGQYAASSSLDSIIRVWNVEDGARKADIEAPPSEVWGITFAPGTDRLQVAAAGGSSNKVAIYSVDSPNDAPTTLAVPVDDGAKHAARDKFVLCVAYSPDGRRLAAGTTDGSVVVLDVETGKAVHRLEGHFKPVRDVTFTPDSRMVLTACNDMHSHLYDASSGALIEAFSGHESWVLSVDVHPGGGCFVTGSSDSRVKLWDLGTRTCVQTLAEHSDQVWDVAFRGDGARLASVSDGRSVALWDFA